MKKLNFIDKILFFINSLVVIGLLITYIIPFIDPTKFTSVSLLSLASPTLFFFNLVFVIFWIVKLKPHFLLSIVVIFIGYNHVKALFPLNSIPKNTDNEISILNFNVRQFNIYNWIDNPNIKKDISSFINKESPDIVCFQEYRNTKNFNLNLPNKYIYATKSSGQAIYSKYQIINKGSLNFKNSSNNTIFIDIKIKNKIVRIYNVHLQSFSLDTKKEYYGTTNKKILFKRFKRVFNLQAEQIKHLKTHINNSKYPAIISGDFNNTAFSWNYKQLTEDHNDSFVEAGNGFGKTYDYFLPFRIDFIFTPKNFKVNYFKSYKVKLSDHYPIMTKINMNN